MNRAASVRITLLALLWGSGFLWIAIALRGLSPVQISFARLALGATVLVPFIYLRHYRLPQGIGLWAHLIAAALFANAIPYTLFAIAERYVSSGVAGVINATTPLWTLAIAFGTGHDRSMTRVQVGGFILGFLGTVLIFQPWNSETAIASWAGLACLAAAASYGISYVYMDRYLARRGIAPLVLSASQLLAATCILAIVVPFAGLQPVRLSAEVVAAILILGLFGTGLAYVINYRLITDEGHAASVVTYLLPIVALILGVLILSESVSAWSVAGVTVVLAGVALTRHTTAP